MAGFDLRKQWWLVIVLLGVLGFAVILLTEQFLPAYQLIGTIAGLLLIGAGFCWAYLTDRERAWWAVIPGLALFVLVAVMLLDAFVIGIESKNDWLDVLALGVGSEIIAFALQRLEARRVLMIVAAFCFLVGILMAPVGMAWKIVMIIVDFAATAYLLWRNLGK